MPVYEYRCRRCGERFNRVEPIDEHGTRRPACPKCKGEGEQVFSPFFAKTARKS